MPNPSVVTSAIQLWNSLEIAKLVIAVLTPLSVAAFGWFISRRLKRLELLQWSNQKLIEKRLALYDSIAPQLNKLLCFYTWVGHWKDVSPDDVIKAKRDLDQCMHIYRHLFEEDVYEAYDDFIHKLFETFQGPGEDAKIRSLVQGPDGDRTRHCSYQWQQAWTCRFTTDSTVPPHSEIQRKYFALMNAITKSLGVRRS